MGNDESKCVAKPTLDDFGSKSAETLPLESEAKRLSITKHQHLPNDNYFIETRPNLRPTRVQSLHNTSKKANARRSSHNYIYNGGGVLTTRTTLDFLEPDGISSPSLSPETNSNNRSRSNSAAYTTSGDTEYCGYHQHEPQRVRKVSSPSLQPKPTLSIHKRSQSDHPPNHPSSAPPKLKHRVSAQSTKSTEREKERRRKSKKRKRRKSKLKKMRSLQHDDRYIDRESEMEAKYISQQVETEYLKKQNEELKRQNLMLRQKFMSIEDDDDGEEDEKEKLPEIPNKSDSFQYQTQHRVSLKQSSSPKSNAIRKKSRHSRVKLKLSGNQQISQRDGHGVYKTENISNIQPRRPIVAVAPRPSLQPIFSKDDGQQFDEHIKLKDKASGRGRYYSDGSILIPDQVMTDGIKMGISMDRMVNGHRENIWNLSFDGQCENVEKCVAIQRIIFALKWYSNAHGDADVIWKRIRDKRYGAHLITDYHHVMHYHLDRGDAKSIQQEKMQICGLIYKLIPKCDANLCLGYKRKQIEVLENSNNDNDSDKRKSVELGHIPFYVHCMDTIHCYFMHFPSIQLQQ